MTTCRSEQNDGGPAFPVMTYNDTGDISGTWLTDPGMSLRDWYAGQALVGISIALPDDVPKEVAQRAYKYADAMLAERGRE